MENCAEIELGIHLLVKQWLYITMVNPKKMSITQKHWPFIVTKATIKADSVQFSMWSIV